MKNTSILLRLAPALLLGCLAAPKASAITFASSGVFTADNSTFELSFTSTGIQNYTFSTSSFAAGGFVPVLTLFNDTTGAVIGSDGADGPCITATTCHDDATLNARLGTGAYDLFLTEFPNVANGKLSAGFLFASDPTATGDLCGVAGGKFLQTDTSVCTQRTANYALSVTSSVTPEPAGWTLVLLPGVLLLGFARRTIA